MTTNEKQEYLSSIRANVREHYGKIAAEFSPEVAASCCDPGDSHGTCCAPVSAVEIAHVSRIYETSDAADLPTEVTGLSLGCGDPVTLASLQPGQTVLDLGSGGGIDCFLAGQQVGDSGHVIGVDMTAAMIEKARTNKAKLGATNVEFRLGEIEHMPVADETVDVVISNCVINLSPDKPQVFREAYRVLRPGGRLAVSDIVINGPLPSEITNSLNAWAGCVAGALEVKEYVAAIEAAGFEEVELASVNLDQSVVAEAAEQLDLGITVNSDDELLHSAIVSAKVRARKPCA
jgi:SAM-dependent methyltransferase